MLKRFALGICGFASLLAMPVQAASISLVPSAETVQSGELFTVDLVLAAADAPGNHPGSFGGKVAISFNSDIASAPSFTHNAESLAVITFGPSAPSGTGNSQSIELWFEQALDEDVIGSFSFLAGAVGTANLGIADADDFGSFFNAAPSNVVFTPQFNGASVEVVPVPAAIWLFGTALGLLGFGARRRPGR